MISQTAEYALRAVVWLAANPERAHGTPQIAAAVKVPAGYLAKVMQRLARAGLVVSSPGRLGGFRIARPATEVSVFDVVNAVDPIRRIHTCPLGLKSHGDQLCPLHRRLDEAAEAVQSAFAGSTIADLLREETTSPPLCEA